VLFPHPLPFLTKAGRRRKKLVKEKLLSSISGGFAVAEFGSCDVTICI
jgi:hypothetical protein